MNRRQLFTAGAAAAAAVAVPVSAQALTPDPWDEMIDGLAFICPELVAKAHQARAEGWAVSELKFIWIGDDKPYLQFQRTFNNEFTPATFYPEREAH